MAAQQPPRPQAHPAAESVRANGLLRILGTRGRKPAAALQAKHDLQRRKNHAINPNKKHGNQLHEPTSMAKFRKKATLLRSFIPAQALFPL
jgi:hypothetical protein